MHYGHCNITQSSTRHRGKSKHDPNRSGSVTTITASVPVCACPIYWKTHNISLADLMILAQNIQANTLWLVVLLLGVDASISCIKPSFASWEDVLVSSKGIAIKKIIRQSGHVFADTNKLTNVCGTMYPMHRVSVNDLNAINRNIHPNLSPLSETNVSYIHQMLGAEWLPISLEPNGCVKLIRVMDLDLHCKPVPAQNFNLGPVVVNNAGKCYALIEETIVISA